LQDQGRCWLISEFMPGGTLAQWLHADKGPLGPNKPLLQRAQRALDVSGHQPQTSGLIPAPCNNDAFDQASTCQAALL
jgi:hypothetical protein